MKYAVTFRNQLAPEHVKEAFDASMKLLTSNHFILHQYAAHTMERVMLVKQKGTQMHLINNTNTKVGPIIAMLFNAFDVNPAACNSHYLMKAMMRSLTMIDAETAKSSGEIVNKLAVMIASAVKNPVDSLHLHLLFESLCILIKQAYFVVEGGIDKYILPLIENVLANDVVEFVPYALQITALLVDQASEKKLKTGTSELESYLPFLSYLMKEELWMRNSNIPAALIVVESFIQSHDEYMLQTHGATLQAIFQRLIGSKALDQHGFYLANALLPFCDKTDKVTSVSLLTPMFRRIQFSKTTKFMKQFILFLCRFAIIRGGAHVCQAIESVQTGMYSMVVEKLLIPELKTMHNTTNFEEKRQCCIGVSNLLAETVDRLGPCYATLIEAIVQLVEGCGQKTLGVGADEEEDRYDLIDTEYNDPFCKLNYAQHNKELAADIKNFKAYLAHSVAVRAVTVKPDSTSCVPESVKAVLSSYAQSSS
ncbi:hypothetical protein AB6A40_003350 [Gnathostoma spinigerum]|uniref:Exportin-1 C-terminal domain-containing protein n=1 Tax=Gnathostoma spinigerum TaxID=75299 RepID=A0ABD6EAJ0_9BILA